jgi:carboxylesterase type B
MFIIEALALVVLISLSIPVSKAIDTSPMAQTQQGVYIGRQITINGTNVNYWYGIPYAEQPIGNLRWMPPRTLATSNGTKEAYIPNACLQEYDFGIQRTEACLTLNVYAPENANNLPVFVWIHGGGFYAGSGAEYNSTPFVSTSMIHSVPVVTVTINYRQGLFGFLADEGLYGERSGMDNRNTTGNYGILDQIVALDWIKKNIAGFGGNPEQITVDGESGGGISITILLTSSLVPNGVFQRVIVQSGSMWPNLVDTLQVAINNTGNVLRTITNCTTVQCLRNLTGDQILTAQRIIASKRFYGIPAFPAIDGYVLNDILENYYARGNFQKVPILIGATANETTTFTYPIVGDKATSTQVQEFLKTQYNTTIIDEIPTIYGPISAFDNPFTYLNILYTDAWILCGARRIAAKFSSYGLPTYLFTYNHLVSAAPSWAGVTHGVELPMLFPTILSYFYRNYTFTASDRQLSTNMMLYWAHFICNSNPNYNGNPANWDTYLGSTDSDLVLQINPQMRNHYYYPTCSRSWDRYAVLNGTAASSAVQYDCYCQYFLLLTGLFVLRFSCSFF